jgi:hypothetical protein
MPIVPFTPGDPFTPFKPYEPNEDSEDIIKKIYEKISPKKDPSPLRIISEEEWLEYLRLKKKAAEYDARTNQPDCVKPDVDEWEQDIEAFLILMGLLTEEDFETKLYIKTLEDNNRIVNEKLLLAGQTHIVENGILKRVRSTVLSRGFPG